MAFLAKLNLLRWRPSLHPFPKHSIPFSTSTAKSLSEPDLHHPEPVIASEPQPQPPKCTVSTPKPQDQEENLEVVICRMMANRPWTTELENSIKSLVPRFDSSLVWKVLHGANCLDQAHEFYIWVQRAGLFTHDKTTIRKLTQICGRHYMMEERNITPNVISYTSILEGYVALGKVDDAWKIYEEMKRCGIKLNSFSLKNLFSALCDAKKSVKARYILWEMEDRCVERLEKTKGTTQTENEN